MSIVKRQLNYASFLFLGIFLILSQGFSTSLLQNYYLSISLVGGAFFAWDKSAAIAGRTRIAEKTILTLAALGAGLAILLLMKPLRHKTLKSNFIFYISLITIVHSCFLLVSENHVGLP